MKPTNTVGYSLFHVERRRSLALTAIAVIATTLLICGALVITARGRL